MRSPEVRTQWHLLRPTGQGPEDDLRPGVLGWAVCWLLGGEASAGAFLGADVGPVWAHGYEVARIGDLGGEVGLEIVEVRGGKKPRRH